MGQIKLKANINECVVEGWQSNAGEVNARVMHVEMSEDLLTCDKQFVTFELADGTVYESLVVDGKAKIPIFEKSQFIKIGMYAENVNGDECEKRYSAHPANQYVTVGSFKGKANKPPKPTPGDYAELLERIEDIENTGGGGSGDGCGITVVDEPDIEKEYGAKEIYNANVGNLMFNELFQLIEGQNIDTTDRLTEYTEHHKIPNAKAVYDYGQMILSLHKNSMSQVVGTDTNSYPSCNAVVDALKYKQDLLINNETIKTINGESILGRGRLYLKTVNGESILGQGDISTSGGGGSTEEEWVEVLNTTLTEDVAYVDMVAPDGKMFKKLHILISTGNAGLSTASKIQIKGKKTATFAGNPGEQLTITSGTINTWGYPTFVIEKGVLFPITYVTQGALNGSNSTPVSIGGAGQLHSQAPETKNINNGSWKIIRIQPYTADVVFKAGVSFYAWGVYEDV